MPVKYCRVNEDVVNALTEKSNVTWVYKSLNNINFNKLANDQFVALHFSVNIHVHCGTHKRSTKNRYMCHIVYLLVQAWIMPFNILKKTLQYASSKRNIQTVYRFHIRIHRHNTHNNIRIHNKFSLDALHLLLFYRVFCSVSLHFV